MPGRQVPPPPYTPICDQHLEIAMSEMEHVGTMTVSTPAAELPLSNAFRCDCGRYFDPEIGYFSEPVAGTLNRAAVCFCRAEEPQWMPIVWMSKNATSTVRYGCLTCGKITEPMSPKQKPLGGAAQGELGPPLVSNRAA